jgi:hypothetical protein
MSSRPFTITTLKRFNSKDIRNYHTEATKKNATKKLTKLTCLGTTSPSYTSDALLVVSLLGGNRIHVTTNCENPQLRNAQLPDKAGTYYVCANSYISCVRAFACAIACSCVFAVLEILASYR